MKTEFPFWQFPNILTPGFIEFLLQETKDYEKVKGQVGTESVREDESIRQVFVQQLGEFHYFSLMLHAYGVKANARSWNYDIQGSMSCELLSYPAGNGKYDTHMDMLQITDEYARKLTVLALLNDDFEGGKFFFNFGIGKEYVNLEKGSVIVFPAYYPHGVEPVTAGERKSCVTWLIGPNFK